MKVVCDACQAKYQIPDERVAGRKLKIRCRKCGDTIVIRGDQGAQDRTSAESLPPSSVVEWHVSLQGDQHGPYPPEQMAEMLRGGQLSWDAYVWRESYADWRMAGDSDTLVRAVARTAEGATTTDETPTRMVQSSPELSQAMQPAASHAARASAAPVAAHGSQPPHVRSPVNGSRINGGSAASQPPHVFAATGAAAAQALQPIESAGPRVSAEAVLTGERHEDSVLFSTRNLTATPTVTPPRGGYAGGEGSGLIDIRALAALARSNPGATRPSVEEDRPLGKRGSDEVSRLANQTGAFGNLESLSPIDYPPRPASNALPVAILAGSAMIAVAGVIAVYLWRPQTLPPAVAVTAPSAASATQVEQPVAAAREAQPALGAAANPRSPEPRAAAEPEPEPARPAIAAAPVADKNAMGNGAGRARGAIPATTAKATPTKHTLAPEPARGAKTAAVEPKNDSVLGDGSDKKAAKKDSSPSIDDLLLDKKPEPTKAGKGDEASVAGAAPAKAKEPARSRSIDDLLDEAVPTKEASAAKKAAAAEAAGEALPESPSRDQVLAAMRAVTGEVQACAQGQALEASTANVLVTVTGASGRVSSARVTGVVGAVGSCVANAVRNASFPKFAKAQLTFNFPFKLNK